MVVGDGPLRAELEEAAQHHSSRNIFFFGFQNQSRLPDFYALADVFVLPSEFEQWGLVLNEAMNFALPVLTSDGVAAASDLVQTDGNGWTYPTGDVGTLVRHLELLVGDAELRARLGQRSAEIIRGWSFREDAHGLLAALQFLTAK